MPVDFFVAVYNPKHFEFMRYDLKLYLLFIYICSLVNVILFGKAKFVFSQFWFWILDIYSRKKNDNQCNTVSNKYKNYMALQRNNAAFECSQNDCMSLEHASKDSFPDCMRLSLVSDEDHYCRSSRQTLSAAAYCVSDIMAPHSNSLFRVHNLHNAFTLAFLSFFMCGTKDPLIIHTNTHTNSVAQVRSGSLFSLYSVERKRLMSGVPCLTFQLVSISLCIKNTNL